MVKLSFRKSFYLLSIIFLLFLSSCGTYNKQALFRSSSDIDPETLKDVYVVNDQGQVDIYYKIKVGDVISIRNLQNMEFGVIGSAEAAVSAATDGSNTPTFPVDINGTVNLPAIGRVQLAGLTRRDATIKLQDLYETKSLRSPIIELTIINIKVTMFGEFAVKGNFLLERDNIRLEEMIGKAGGFTKDADPRTLKIIRGNKKNPEIIYVNLTNINSLSNDKLVLQNNDIITVEPTQNVMTAQKLQSYNNIIQPLLVIVNLAVLIFTFTR
ncbi:MAG: polysaccharide biosynthesis/export family protein [Bacteroidia bacterium]